MEILDDLDGVDEALDRHPAAQRFWLIDSRIGEIMVFGASDAVFGDLTEGTLPGDLRSHGSLYEEWVPAIGYRGNFEEFEFQENQDLGRLNLLG